MKYTLTHNPLPLIVGLLVRLEEMFYSVGYATAATNRVSEDIQLSNLDLDSPLEGMNSHGEIRNGI